MEQENKKKYETPAMTVVEFKTEQGFAASGMSNYRNNAFESWGFTGDDGGSGSGSGVPGYTNHDSEVW